MTRLCFILCLFVWTSPVWAAPVKPSHAYLQLQSSAEARLKDIRDAWLKVCPLIGQNLLVGQGIWAHGAFASFSCFTDGKITAGVKEEKFAQWRLQFDVGSKSKHVKIQFWDKKAWQTIHQMPLDVANLAALQNPDLAALVALDVSLHMPATRLVEWEKEELGAPAPPESLARDLAPPSSYQVFELRYEDGQWLPHVVGALKLSSPPDATSPKWRLVRNGNETFGGPFWAYADARVEAVAAVQKTLKSAAGQKTDDASLLATFARGYVGLRYGLSIRGEDPLLQKSRLVTVFTEVRGGPLAGLRWYWDFVPLVTATNQGQEVNFALSRPSFGWSIGWDIDVLGLTRFDVTPKIGLSDFRSELPIKTQGGRGAVSSFVVKNAPSLGAELGLEALTPLMLLRFWGASDLSAVVSLGGSKSVSSLRGGVDAYVQVHEFANKYSLSLLAFANMEQLTLEDNVKPDDPAEAARKVKAVSLSLGFVGGGVTLVW